jgi:hypothetical protein
LVKKNEGDLVKKWGRFGRGRFGSGVVLTCYPIFDIIFTGVLLFIWAMIFLCSLIGRTSYV